MLTSQTVNLRKKNEELLNVLKEDAVRLNRKLRDCKDLLRKTEEYNEAEFSEHHRHHSLEIMSPTAPRPSRGGTRDIADLSQPMKALSRAHHSRSPIRIRSSSVAGHHARSSKHHSCVPSGPARRSSPDVRWTKLQQELACQAHMHGYTLSHSLSKCYCTRKESALCGNISGSAKPSCDLKSGKPKIPQRLKEMRYQASAPIYKTCSVKWATPGEVVRHRPPVDDPRKISLPPEDSEQENETRSPRSFCSSSVSRSIKPAVRVQRAVPLNHVHHRPVQETASAEDKRRSECDSDWFAEVKNFRKSNWEDCHAPKSGQGDGNDCKCTGVFMLGERMFLEPVQVEVDKTCGCSSKAREKTPFPSSRENVVTLRKVALDVRESDVGETRGAENIVSNHRREDRALRTYNINRPCFLTGHKTETNEQVRAFLQRRPADSFALRYQKGVDPRAP